nr:replication-associated protein [Carrot mottle virus]
MSFLKRVLKHLDSQFSPAPGVYSRDVCAERYGAEWGVLITQGRMTRALSEEHERWYTGRVETDVYIPAAQYVDPRDVEAEPTGQDGSSTRVDDPVSNSSPTVPAKPTTEVIPVAGLGSTSAGVVPALEGPVPYLGDVYTILRMVDPTAEASESSDEEEDTCCPAYTHAASNSVASHGANAVPPPASGEHPGVSPVGAPSLSSAVGSSPAVDTTHINTVDASSEMPTTVEGPDEGVSTSPLQEAGPSMAFVDASSVAMELRARFGYRSKNPANLELGGRVARDILKGCGAVRSENYYLAQLAVQLWFAPTLLDLVLRGPVQDFC